MGLSFNKLLILVLSILIMIGTVSAISQYNISGSHRYIIIFNGTPGVTTWTPPANVTNISYLVVAGGGSGAAGIGGNGGGGGGAGGLLYSLSYTVVPGTSYNVTVGGGGDNNTYGAAPGAANIGKNSTFANITLSDGISAKGGSYGGYYINAIPAGGSTGGSASYQSSALHPPDGTAGQGNRGGYNGESGWYGGGGGGGAGGPGVNGSASANGNGGPGSSYSISGSSVIYAAGGGSGGTTAGPTPGVGGSSGVGGDGGAPSYNGDPGLKNTGSGGGGGGITTGYGGPGANGTVILQYEGTIAAFNSNVTSGQSPLPVAFTDQSIPIPDSWYWEFGDGNTSSLQNPTYTYPSVGNYTVTLTAYGGGGSNYTMKVNNITALNPPYVPLMNPGYEYGNGTIIPINTAWQWVGSEKYGKTSLKSDDAAAGGSSYIMFDDNESHSGSQSMKIDRSNTFGTNYTFTDDGAYGTYILHRFMIEPDKSYNFSAWVKLNSSSYVTYARLVTGNYSVSLNQYYCYAVSTSGTKDWTFYSTTCDIPSYNDTGNIQFFMYRNGTSWLDDVKLMKMMTPKFYANKTFGSYPLPVLFSSIVTNGTPTYYNWSFGDGNYSTLQNPTFTYNTVGNYTVKLTVANGIGNENPSSITYTNYISVLPLSPISNFTENVSTGYPPFAVQFTDISTRTPAEWSWYFGDEQYNQSWIQQSSLPGWEKRFWSSTVTTSDGDIILMGGRNLTVYFNDTWRSTDKGATWSLMNASSGWNARTGFTNIFSDDSIIIFGGRDASIYFNDTWRSTDKGATWSLMNSSSGWSKRSYGASSVLNDTVILSGGYDGTYKNDTWRSTDKGATWSLINISSGWQARQRFAMVSMMDGSLIITGGQVNLPGVATVNDTWRSTDKGATWSLMNSSSGWISRIDPVGYAMLDNSMMITAGYNETLMGINDSWRTVDGGLHWSIVNISNGYITRWGMYGTTLNDGSVALIGGWNNTSMNDMWVFDPSGSSLQNPVHIYTIPGNYIVRLQSYNRGGFNLSLPQYKIVRGPVISSFYQNDSYGTTLVPVLFNDTSTESPIGWQWNATNVTGNNTPITFSILQNSTFTFDVGNWQIKLKVTNIDSSNISTQNSWVNVTVLPPISSFTENISAGTVPLNVMFTDTSIRNPIGWSWYFGDENYTQPWIQTNPNSGWTTNRKSVVMLDGTIISTGIYPNDTWISVNNGNNWYLVNNQYGWTMPKSDYGLVTLSDGSIVLTGGNSTNFGSAYYDGKETWTSVDRGVTWILTNGSSWDDSLSGVTTVAFPDDTIVLIGGISDFYSLETAHTSSWISTDKGVTWDHNGDLGLGRWGSDGVILPNGNIVIIGGSYNIYEEFTHYEASYNDVWVSADRGITWSQVNTSIFPSPKSKSSSVVIPDGSIVLTGGIDYANSSYTNDTWRSTDGGVTWNILNLSSGWPPRYNHNLVMVPNGSILFIGYSPADVWSFNPSGSILQNPTHTYTAYGNYTVKLLSYNSGGWNISSLIHYIMVNSPPLAQFTINTTGGYGPLLVGFTDTSLYSPTEWNWSYTNIIGNNTDIWFSQLQNPVSIISPGNWSIRLNATNIYGTNISSHNVTFINVTGPVALFGNNVTGGINEATVQFIDNSLVGSPITSWTWNATDIGGLNIPFDFSYDQYPAHTFSIGNYSIVLTIIDSYGYMATSTQTTFINVSSFGNASTVTYPPTLTSPYSVVVFVTKDNTPYVNAKIDITIGMAVDNATTLYVSGYTDSSGKYVFTANNGKYYKINVNNGEYTHIYMGSSTYTTITLNVPVNRLLTRPYEYSSSYDDLSNIIRTVYNDVDFADVNISVTDLTFNGMNVHTASYPHVVSVTDTFVAPYNTHEYKVNIRFIRSVDPSHVYSDDIYLKTGAFNNVVYNVSDQWRLFIYALYTIIMMIVSLSIGYASPKIGSVLLLGLALLGISMGFLPMNMYTGGVLVCGFIAMLEVMRRRPN